MSMLYVAIIERLHVSSTRCDHYRSCHQTISFTCQLKIFGVELQLIINLGLLTIKKNLIVNFVIIND